jgi:hypothetical protein
MIRPVITPIRASTLAAIAVAGLIAGCGSASTSAPSKAAATSAANQINLKPADLPHSTPMPNPNTTSALDSQLASCAGTSPPGAAIVNLNSPSLDIGTGLQQQSFSSNVKVFPSKAIVTKDLAAIRSGKAQACIKSLLPKAIAQSASSRVKFSRVTVAPLNTSVSGADSSFGYRLTVLASAAGRRLTIMVDEFGAAIGRIELTLSDFGIGTPASSATESKLLSTLVAAPPPAPVNSDRARTRCRRSRPRRRARSRAPRAHG